MSQCTAATAGRILDILRDNFPEWKVVTLKQRLAHGLVYLNGKPVRSGAATVKAGDKVEILARPPHVSNFLPFELDEPPLPILYADNELLAIDKPSGLLSVATEREKHDTAVRILRQWLASNNEEDGENLHAAHRLDRDASGVLLMARSLAAKRQLAADWHSFAKVYLAITDGIPAKAEGVIEVPLREDQGLFVRVSVAGSGEPALTRYRVVKTAGRRAMLEVELGTGRKHQIRVHLAHIGCPIVGDLRYGVSKAQRLALHAERLRVVNPTTGREVTITAPVPAFFQRQLRKGEERGRRR